MNAAAASRLPEVVAKHVKSLQQVFTNLLVNAIRFPSTDSGIDIDIEMRSAGGDVEIRVVDHGEGIDADMLPVIFERFRQADGSITRKGGGMGLAPAIARHILDLHAASSPHARALVAVPCSP